MHQGGRRAELRRRSGDGEILGQPVDHGRLLQSLLDYFFSQAAAFAALTGNAQGPAQAPDGGGALVYGGFDLMVSDAFAETDVHNRLGSRNWASIDG